MHSVREIPKDMLAENEESKAAFTEYVTKDGEKPTTKKSDYIREDLLSDEDLISY